MPPARDCRSFALALTALLCLALAGAQPVAGECAQAVACGAGTLRAEGHQRAWSLGYCAAARAGAGCRRLCPTVAALYLYPADDNIWASFSRETNLFYRGAMLAGPAATADSDAACARACAQAPGCILWSFCPLEAAEG